MKEGRKPEYPEKTPGDELQKMPQSKARRFKPQARLEPEARKADVLTVTPRVAPRRQGRGVGVAVSMSAFLACHQCYCAGSSLSRGLNLRAVVCGIF